MGWYAVGGFNSARAYLSTASSRCTDPGRQAMASSDSRKTTTDSQAAAHGGEEAQREHLSPRAYRIPDVCKITGLGRTSVYAAIASGELVARKWRRRTIVLDEDLATFLSNLQRSR
jgi:hypothetical protein